MENSKPSFTFEKGEIIDGDISNVDLISLTIMHNVKEVLKPAIIKNKLSGKINLTFSSDRLHIGYENIKPFEFTADLMELITGRNLTYAI